MKQIPLLSKIVMLRDMGFSIEEIADILPHYDNGRHVEKVLRKKAKDIQATIAIEQARLEKLIEHRFQLQGVEKRMIFDVEVKALPAVNVISLREIISDYSNEEKLWEKMFQFIIDNNIPISKGEGAYSDYLDDEYKENDVEIEISLPVNELDNSDNGFVYQSLKAIPCAATIRFSGPYENYGTAMEQLGAWIEENGYEIVGKVRGVALHDLLATTNPNEFLTELQIPITKTS
jgi:effector-binding domain-containing protein